MRMKRFLVMVCTVVMCVGVSADEGMWTFNNVPRDSIASKYNVTLPISGCSMSSNPWSGWRAAAPGRSCRPKG